jgi:hypothetical protein
VQRRCEAEEMKQLLRFAICVAASLWFSHEAETHAASAIGLLAFYVFFFGTELHEKLKEVRKALGIHTDGFFRKFWN